MSQPNGIREKFKLDFGKWYWETGNFGEMKGIKHYLINMEANRIADFFISHFSTELNNLEERIKGEYKISMPVFGINHSEKDTGFNEGIERILSLLEELRNKYK